MAGILSRVLRTDTQVQEKRGTISMSLSELDYLMDAAMGSALPTATGRTITPDSALQMSAVFACVRVISETIASLPLITYRRLADGGKERATDHPLYRLLHDAPNPEMTRMEMWEALVAHIALRGNAYAEIQRNTYTGDPVALWPLRPDRMSVTRENNQLWYIYRMPDGTDKAFRQWQILHLRGLGSNGISGYSVIELNREAVGLGLATEEFGARWFGNGARPSVVLQHPGQLSDIAYNRLRNAWEARHMGLSNAQRVAILEEGMKVETIGVPPEDSQFLETRKFQVTEIARMFRVPPHMIGDLDRATFSNIEQQSIDFVVNTIRPWAERIEQRIEASLLSRDDWNTYFVEHMLDGLLRGDLASRYSAYATGRQWGWLSADDIRALENMNPLPDGAGQIYLQPMNMVPAGSEPEEPEPQPEAEEPVEAEETEEETEEEGERNAPQIETADLATDRELRTVSTRRRIARSYKGTLRHVAQRVVNREVNDIRNAAKRMLSGTFPDREKFEVWLREFDTKHSEFVHDYLTPPLRTYAEIVSLEIERETGKDVPDNELDEFVGRYVNGRTGQWMAHLMGGLRSVLADKNREQRDIGDPPPGDLELIEAYLEERQNEQASDFADDESTRANNAVAVFAYSLIGISFMKWRSFGENCPYCNHLNDKTVEVTKTFLVQGEGLSVPGVALSFTSSTNVSHPPLHRGCDCQIVAVL